MDTQDIQPLYLGIDGGASKCRARIENAMGQLLGQGIAGPANPSYGIETVMQSIKQATTRAMHQAGIRSELMSELTVGAGIAGLHLPKYIELIKNAPHPFKQFYFTDDVHTACLGAHKGNDGAVIIIGTGFSALSVVTDKHYRVGGHGFLMADQCSGSWIGYSAVNAALLAWDKLGPQTRLTQLLQEKFSAKGLLLADALVGARAKDYGALAPLVFQVADDGDSIAQTIIQKGADFIGRTVRLLLKTEPPRLSLVGGVAEHIIDKLDAEIVQVIAAALKPPEAGAIYYAKSMATKQGAYNKA